MINKIFKYSIKNKVKHNKKDLGVRFFFCAFCLLFFSTSLLANQSFPQHPPMRKKLCCDEKQIDSSLMSTNAFDSRKKVVQCTPITQEHESIDQVVRQLDYPTKKGDSNISNHSETDYPTDLKCAPSYSVCKWVDADTPCGDETNKTGQINWSSDNPDDPIVKVDIKTLIRYDDEKQPYYAIFISGDWKNHPASSTVKDAQITYRYKIFVSNPVTYFFTQGYNGGVVPTENNGTALYFSNDTNGVNWYGVSYALAAYKKFEVSVTVEAYDNYGNHKSVVVDQECTPARPPDIDKDGYDKLTCEFL